MAKVKGLKNLHRLINETVSTLSPDGSFVYDLNAAIERQDFESNKDRQMSRSYKPSSMNCIRQMYFMVSGEPAEEKRSSAGFVGICESGTDRHVRIQNAVMAMKRYGMDCEYIDVERYIEQQKIAELEVIERQGNEVKLFHKTLNLRFLCDGVIKYKGEYYVLEIKTETARKFGDRVDVDDGHRNQATAYAVSFHLSKVLFLYENRDTCEKKAYILNVSSAMKQDFVSRIEICDDYIKRIIPPPIPADISPKVCQYCLYTNACRRAG